MIIAVMKQFYAMLNNQEKNQTSMGIEAIVMLYQLSYEAAHIRFESVCELSYPPVKAVNRGMRMMHSSFQFYI